MSNVKWRRGFFRLWVVGSVLWLFVAAGVTGFTGMAVQVGQEGFANLAGRRFSNGRNPPAHTQLATPWNAPSVQDFINGARAPATQTPETFSFEDASKPPPLEDIPGATIDFAALEKERDRIPREQYGEIAWSFVGLGAAVPMCFFILGCAVVWVLSGFSKRP